MDDLDSSRLKLFYVVSMLATYITICESFLHHAITNTKCNKNSKIISHVAPKRLEDNADGVMYVNEKCISCSACAMFAPETFAYSTNHRKFIVTKQPENNSNEELLSARAAMSACPVGAIRVENSAQRNHNGFQKLTDEESELAKSLILNPKINDIPLPFPRSVPGLSKSIFHLGYHNKRSFGAVPYLIKDDTTLMVDTPKYSPSSVRAVTSLCGENGPDYLFLTHVDDVADHDKWKDHFPNLKRIIHESELENNWIGDEELENIEIILSGSVANNNDKIMSWTLDGDGNVLDLSKISSTPEMEVGDKFTIFHTPGHSLGSISLLYHSSQDNKNVLFTGDTYGYSIRLQSMTAFPYYGDNLKLQSQTLRKLLHLPWDFIAPGHGCYKDYKSMNEREKDVEQAIENMRSI